MSSNAVHSVTSKMEEVKTVDSHRFVTMRVDTQLFGIPVGAVHDVHRTGKITPIPKSAKEITGALNLRGRIVTAVDMRARLGLSPAAAGARLMSIVVEVEGDWFSLIVDTVGEVLELPASARSYETEKLSPKWRDIASCIYPLDKELLVILDINFILRL